MSLPKTSLEQWAVLAAIVDAGGYAQAAASLHRSQSAVSYAVARLQESLGVPLLALEGRKALLTANGATLLKRARVLLADVAALERLARSLTAGWESELALVVDAAYPRPLLLRIVAELQDSCPATQIQLAEVILSGAEEAIVDGSGDVVVTSRVPPGHLGEKLIDVTFRAVARADHPLLLLERELTGEDLARHVQAVVRDSGSHNPRSEGWLGAARRFTVSSMEASLAALRAGLAFAWLPDDLTRALLSAGELRALPLAVGATREVALSIVMAQRDAPGPAARAALAAFQRHSAVYRDGR
jgi:DNA-binding transcriptional LysR family regulator